MAQNEHAVLETEDSKARGYSLAHLTIDPVWLQHANKDDSLSRYVRSACGACNMFRLTQNCCRDASSVEDKDTVKAANGRTYHSLNAGSK